MSDFRADVRVRPLNGRVLVREKEGDRTPGGIILPPSSTTRLMIGEVLDVSPGYYTGNSYREHQVHIGDTVIYPWKAGADVNIEEDHCRLVHENEIVAILEGYNG